MKKTFFLVVGFLISSLPASFSQQLLQTIANVDLGRSKTETETALTAFGAEKTLGSGEDVTFWKLKNNGLNATTLLVRFENNLSSHLSFTIKTELDRLTVEQFTYLKDRFDQVYGQGHFYKSFEFPYMDGDGHEVDAIKVNKGVYKCIWPLTTGTGRSLVMGIVQDGTIRVDYSMTEYNMPK